MRASHPARLGRPRRVGSCHLRRQASRPPSRSLDARLPASPRRATSRLTRLNPSRVLPFPRADDEEFEVPDLAKETEAKAKITSDPRFADEDAEEEEKPKPVAKKPVVQKKTVAQYVDETLDDPVAEKARRQKLVEEADLAAAKELFGTDGEEIDLTTYNPRSEKEFTKFGNLLATKFLVPVKESGFFKETVKAFVKSAAKYMSAADVKEVEATIVALRNEKVKAEKADAIATQRRRRRRRPRAARARRSSSTRAPRAETTGSRTTSTATTPSTTSTISCESDPPYRRVDSRARFRIHLVRADARRRGRIVRRQRIARRFSSSLRAPRRLPHAVSPTTRLPHYAFASTGAS